MATYINSMILFVLCALLFPAEALDAFHIACMVLLFAAYCFELVVRKEKVLVQIGAVLLILCLLVPEVSVFLPLSCYVYFYRRLWLIPALYSIPAISAMLRTAVCPSSFLLAGLSFYLAYECSEKERLLETIHSLRDNSVEEEMALKEKNRRLLETQNDQIYIATLRERNRIAKEIHDNVGHLLSRSLLLLGAIVTMCKEEHLSAHLKTLQDTLNLAMDNIRNSVHDLHDESIDLTGALEGLRDSYTFCPVTLTCDVSRQIPKNIKYCFLAITKEAMNNTMKHSNATSLTITVREHPAFYQLLLEDNGTTAGTDTDYEGAHAGIGLSGMRERVAALHGIIHISSERGFRIFISVPKSSISVKL